MFMHNIVEVEKIYKKLDGYFFVFKTYFYLLAVGCAAQIVEKAFYLTDKASDFESVNLVKMKSFLLNECWVYQNSRSFRCGLAVIQKEVTSVKQKLEYWQIFSVMSSRVLGTRK